MTHPTIRNSLLALLMATSFPAVSASYYVVAPVPGKKVLNGAISVALNSYSAPSGQVGVSYPGLDLRTLLTVAGDSGYSGYGVKWQVVAGRLPAGLTLNGNGTISGTPTTAESAMFTVRAAYKTQNGDQQYQIVTYRIDVALAAGSTPQALAGQPYSYDLKPLLAVSGDPAFAPASVTWSVVSSTLPAGLYLTTDGRIAGTATAGGTGTLTARASYKGVAGEQTYQVVSVNITVSLAAATLPAGVTGESYPGFDFKNVLSVSGDPAYAPGAATWSLVSGSLPTGLTLGANGVVSGTPSTAATANFTLSASYRNRSAQHAYAVLVDAAVVTGALSAPAGYDYGTVTVGGSASRSFTFTNDGNTSATGVYAMASGPGMSVTTSTCGTPGALVSLSKGASCTFTARYAPTSAGTMAGAVAVKWSGPVAGSQSQPVTGAARVDYSSLMAGFTSDVVAIGTNAAWLKDVPWYWRTASAEVSADPGTFEFRRTITVAGNSPVDVYLYGGVDDVFAVLSVNGVTKAGNLPLGFSVSAQSPAFSLQPGVNVIAVQVENGGAAANPAGLALQVRNPDGSVRGSEAGWKFSP
jgi:hypothetical protein